ncbi:MAG: arylsulfatase [Planctomycetota bacterium]
MRAAVLAIAGTLASVSISSAGEPLRPNVVLFLADDLGLGDVGAYGQEKIRTPNVDRMAAEGVRFLSAYAGNAVCAPSRCVLLTGKHPGHAWIRDNREVKPEGQEPLRADETTIAELLRTEGYATAAVGKWGLGPPGSEGDPLRQGFERFFGYNCQRHAHNHFPTYLYRDREKVPLGNPEFSAYEKLPEGANLEDPATYARFGGSDYAPDRFAEEALRFIRENRERPFFLYYATTVPHLALQVPADSLAEYEGRWTDPPYAGDRGYLPHRRPRAAYAAMVTRLDRDVGRVLRLLEELRLDERTICIFTSDNGPAHGGTGGSDSEFFRSGRGLRGLKGSLYEGGIRVPFIVRWKGRIRPGSVSDRVVGFEDLLPTILELAGAGRSIPPGLDGVSCAPCLFGREQPPRPFLYREFPGYGGQQSLRLGRWKAIRTALGRSPAPPPLELYDLEADPGETKDVAGAHPEVIAEIEAILRREHERSERFPLPALDR